MTDINMAPLKFENAFNLGFVAFYIKDISGFFADQMYDRKKKALVFTPKEIADIAQGKKLTLTIGAKLKTEYDLKKSLSSETTFSPFLSSRLFQYVNSIVPDLSMETNKNISLDSFKSYIPKILAYEAQEIMIGYRRIQNNAPIMSRMFDLPKIFLSNDFEDHRYLMKVLKDNPRFPDIDDITKNISIVYDIPENFHIIDDFPKTDLYFAKIPLSIQLDIDHQCNPKYHHFTIEKIENLDYTGFSPDFENKDTYHASYSFYSKEYDETVEIYREKSQRDKKDYFGTNVITSSSSGFYLYTSHEDAINSMRQAKDKLKSIYDSINS